MRFTVIVPAHNRAKKLNKTLETLVDQDYASSDLEIIVADNCSTDSTREVVESWRGKSAASVIYHFEKRPGVHYARNSAALLSKADILYFTDDDMEAEPNVLTEFDLVLRNFPEVSVVMGRVLPKWEVSPPDWVLQFCDNANLSLQYRNEDLIVSAADVGVYGCHEAIRKDVLLKCGGFRPENTAGEWVGDGETGLHLKMIDLGFKFGFTNRAVTYHVIPPERLTQAYFNKRLANQGAADSFTRFNRREVAVDDLRADCRKYRLRIMRERLRSLRARLNSKEHWRFHRAQQEYWRSRYKYDQRLIEDSAWRKYNLSTDWFSHNEKSDFEPTGYANIPKG